MKLNKGVIGLLLAAVFIGACNGPYQQPAVVYTTPAPVVSNNGYQVIRDPNTGQQMAVYTDNSGQELLMDYIIFNQLMNNGGWGGIYSYGRSNPTRIHVYNQNVYHNWSTTRTNGNYIRGGLRSTSNSSSTQFRNTTPANGLRSNSTPSTPAFRSTTPSNGLRSNSSSSSFRSTTTSRPSSGFRSSGRH